MATHKVTSFLKGVREYVTPVLQSSAFLEKGVLTPDEFVAAGDQLVYRCPTWSWEAGDPSKAKSYLPRDKQFLVTRNVPCHRRATAFEKEYVAETELEGSADDGEEGWLATHVAAAPSSSSSSAGTHSGNSSTGAGGGNHREQTLHLGVEGVLQQLEEVDLGGSGGHEPHTATEGGAAVVSPPPEGVVLVGGEGEEDGEEEEEEPGRATVVLAPGMVTVVDEHFSAGREDGGGGQEEEEGGRVDMGIGSSSTAAAGSGTAAAAGGEGQEGEEEDDMAGYADLASYEESALAAGALEDEAILPTASTSGGTQPPSQQAQQQPSSLSYLRAEEPPASALASAGARSGLLSARSYDISITYDKYYQTPRAWLMGYDEEGQPLRPAALFEDIMQDYANRTVTVETHPHTGLPQASIHPCQHANVMKNIVGNLKGDAKDGDVSRVPRVDQYLFIFLKFLQSVIPTIEYDFTITVEGR